MFTRVASRVRVVTAGHWLYLVLHVVIFGIGIFLVSSDQTWVAGVGTSLVAAGVAGWVLFVWVMLNETQARRLALLTQMGFVDAFDSRASSIRDEYDERIGAARQAIDVLGFGLRQLREDYGDQFGSWSARVPVRILRIDPQTPGHRYTNADQRDREEGNPVGSISADVKAFLDKTAELRADPEGRFKVRLYTALPSINIFRVDDAIFWGPYLVKRQSRNTPTFLIRRGGTLFDTFTNHFDQLWNDETFSHEPPSVS